MSTLQRFRWSCWSLAGILGWLLPAPAWPEETAVADVAVVVDTSNSMREAGMDPERASLLVTKLLVDIVPGDLAVIRLLDLHDDEAELPSRDTGITMPCSEDPTQTCHRIEPAINFDAAARSKLLGVLARPARGDAAYKRQLESHLEQRSNNSMFNLALRAGQGVFDRHRAPGRHGHEVPRTVIWLSDGRSDSPEAVRRVVAELRADDTVVIPIIFGRGDTTLAREAGLEPLQVSSPAGIMKAFAGAFRRVVQAPYDVDNLVATAPSFDMKHSVDEAWIVVYGNETLGEVRLDGPGGSMAADYAADRWPGAGAYKVAYVRNPAAGRWTVHASGGGDGTAYAVVQRSSLRPVLLAPLRTAAGVRVPLVAGLRAGTGAEVIADAEVLGDLTVTAEVQGQVVTLADGGAAGDAIARDGRFAGWVTFQATGKVPVRIRARSPLIDRTVDATVDVAGSFRYTGGPLEVDLGTLGVNAESCRPLALRAEHRGEVPFELRALRRLAGGHRLELRLATMALTAGGSPRTIGADEPLSVCLVTSPRAASSQARGEPWLELRVAGSDAPQQRVTVRLRWQVRGLSVWDRWGWLILSVLALLILLAVILGFVLPQRFQGTFAVTYVPERDELDEQTPQPVKQWRGVGIGFYRDARAFLHPDFRLSGNPQGALAGLFAEKGGARVAPGRGLALFRETLDGDWEAVAAAGRRARAGDVYRIGQRGPFFRIASHRGGR
ncbi:MAG TPA: choice-of-anchor X domain-containing protein [Thermoanaerobaculia bacterium]|nr:choice-of-anchor X domain-containing protein [Thermoanaerobaculia bacterium]